MGGKCGICCLLSFANQHQLQPRAVTFCHTQCLARLDLTLVNERPAGRRHNPLLVPSRLAKGLQITTSVSSFDFLDEAAIAAAAVHTDPYEDAFGEQAIPSIHKDAVLADAPSIPDRGSYGLPSLRYGPCFGVVIRDLLSSRFRQLMEAKFDLDLSQRPPVLLMMGNTTGHYLEFALWNRQAVSRLIEDRLGTKVPIHTIGEYLKRWGFTPQKPIKKAYEQRPAQVRKWLEEDYPRIAARAKGEGAEIHWGDETGPRSDHVRGRGYAPKGQTPVVRVNNKREGLSIISTVTNQGKVRWKVFEGAMNANVLIDFFRHLLKDADRKVSMILDNLKVHHAHKVKDWLADHKEQTEVFYLPSYSPELNPDECLNSDLKDGITRRAPARSKAQLKKAANSHLRKIQKSPQRVRKYFEHKPVRYAA